MMMVRPSLTIIRPWSTMVDPEQTIWTWSDLGGPCFSNGMMVWTMVNHGQMVMTIFSQSWSSLMDDPVILTMVRTWLTIVSEGLSG